jgi:phage head maturation protease
MKPIFKSVEIKAASLTDNYLKGAASVMGVMDSQDDVIFPGAFKSCLNDFLKNGFVPVGHDWSSLPVAMPMIAREEGNQLYTEAQFHSTDEAQEARTICVERLANGLSVGLSVGFMPDYDAVAWFENGKALLNFAEKSGADMSLFDTKGIAKNTDYCRAITNVKRLFEYSITPIPANTRAVATDAKGFDPSTIERISTVRGFEDTLRDLGLSRKQTQMFISRFRDTLRDAGNSEPKAAETLPPVEDPMQPITPVEASVVESLLLRSMSLHHAVTSDLRLV